MSRKKGYKQSEETKEKIRIKAIGRLHTEKTKKKLSKIHFKRLKDPNERRKCNPNHSLETRKKMSEIKKKQLAENPKYLKQLRTQNKGKHNSPSTEFKKGFVGTWKGKKLSKEHKQKLCDNHWSKKVGFVHPMQDKKHTSESRRKQRNSKLEYINKSLLKGEQISPTVGKHETRILDIFEEFFTYPILRQYRVAGYFLDGYCPALHLAIEVDEKHHNRKKNVERDLFRQKEIEEELRCSFLRIKIPGVIG